MAEISAEEDLNESHEVFASEVVRALNKFYLIDLAQKPVEAKYLTDDICWGIITIAFVSRKKNYRVFKALREDLRDENFFRECCMFIPTWRTDRFFFNFLKRVSKIYEMAVFCYRNNHKYIDTAQNCIAQFQEKEFFKSAGSWQRLDRIGKFLTQWSKRLQPVMVQEIPLRSPVLLTTSDEVPETHLDEEKLEEFNSNDKDSSESFLVGQLISLVRDRKYNPAVILLLADEFNYEQELGSIQDEINSIARLLTFLPPKITNYYNESSEDSKNQNIRAESLKPQMTWSRLKMLRTGRKTANTKSKTLPSILYCKLLADEMMSTFEKLRLKAKSEELGRVEEETKACFQESSDSTNTKFTSCPESSKENQIGYSILKGDLSISGSATDEESERLSADKDCNENKIPSDGDLHQIYDNTSASCSDWTVPTKYTTNSLDGAESIKFLKHDFSVKAGNYTSFSNGNSDSDNAELHSAINSLADETNNEEQLTTTKSVKSSSFEAVEKPNMSNAKPKKRKTKKRQKKRGKSKK